MYKDIIQSLVMVIKKDNKYYVHDGFKSYKADFHWSEDKKAACTWRTRFIFDDQKESGGDVYLCFPNGDELLVTEETFKV